MKNIIAVDELNEIMKKALQVNPDLLEGNELPETAAEPKQARTQSPPEQPSKVFISEVGNDPEAIGFYVGKCNDLHARRQEDRVAVGRYLAKIQRMTSGRKWEKVFPTLGLRFSKRTASRYMRALEKVDPIGFPSKERKERTDKGVKKPDTQKSSSKPSGTPKSAPVNATFSPDERDRAAEQPVQPFSLEMGDQSVRIDWNEGIVPSINSDFSALQSIAAEFDAKFKPVLGKRYRTVISREAY